MTGTRYFRFLGMALLAFLAVALALTMSSGSADGPEDDLAAIPEKKDPKYPNLGSKLNGLVVRVEHGEATAEHAAGETQVHREESVAVTIYLSSGVDEVVKFLEDYGGDLRNAGEDYIEAYVPLPLLGPVSQRPGVIRVREIVPPQPEYGNFTSQGVQAHLSQAWNDAGYSGQGVRVGIIDTGFRGLTSLMGDRVAGQSPGQVLHRHRRVHLGPGRLRDGRPGDR